MNRFCDIHPAVSALYFISVLMITMFTVNPVLLGIALCGAVLFCLKISKFTLKELSFYLLLFLLAALTNPLFNHNGVTPLFFLNGNPVTLEAVLYGFDIALMLAAVVFWFKCFNTVMTQDKLLFLFGKISPGLSLLLSSALRFIPRLKRQADSIRQSQKALGVPADKLCGTLKVYSALVTWGLENAIDTGSSMKARGYGLRGRSCYSIYSFRRSDVCLLGLILLLDALIVFAMSSGHLYFSFYPVLDAAPFDALNILATFAFAALSLLPFIFEVKETLSWKYYVSKI